MSKAAPTTTEHAEEPVAKKPGGAAKIMMVGFISVVVLVETALFFFLIPSAEDVAALAEARLVQNIKSGETTESHAEKEEQVVEFPLGQFGVVFSPVDSEANFRVEFNLFGLLRKAKADGLKEDFKAKEGRVRHEVLMKVRTSTAEELEENNLGSIQRRILATCNQLLDEPVLLSVGFQDFQVFEQ